MDRLQLGCDGSSFTTAGLALRHKSNGRPSDHSVQKINIKFCLCYVWDPISRFGHLIGCYFGTK